LNHKAIEEMKDGRASYNGQNNLSLMTSKVMYTKAPHRKSTTPDAAAGRAENGTDSKRALITNVMLRDKREKRPRLVAAAFSPFCSIKLAIW